ncbi:MAG TPA: CoA-acylating methylmalonate-semialdehyde dehydrogenase [Candidatus Limnocylindrales bacterium]
MTQLAEPAGSTSTSLPTIGHWIGGKPVAGTSGRRGPVFNPATGAQEKWVDFASLEELDAAVAAAKAAFPAWRATSLSKRTDIMFRIRNLVDAHRTELAALLTAEHGKVPSDALGELARGIENLEFATGIPQLLKGGFSEQVSSGVDVYQIRQPLGVVAGITPFNFPAMVPMWMFANAIATGNTFILKPSEKDPSASLLLAQLLREAGVPEGVFTVVQGDKVAVDGILNHPDIAAVSFVGSTPIARYIYETGTKNGKRVQALGGAKNHMLVLPDADVNMAADAAVSAGYGSAGERCMAIATVVAVGSVHDPLVEAIKARLPKVSIGPGTDPTAEMGPLVTKQHRDKVASYLESAAEQGATIVADGREHPLYSGSDGFFLGTSLIDDVTPEMDCYRDEIFGPVLTVMRVDTYEEALGLINDNPYGNGTAIFTRDGGAARQFQFDVNVGMVGVNVPIPVPVAYYSFGGWKASLFGDLHMYGPDGIQFYTRSKVVTSRWPDPSTSSVDLGFPRTR